MVNDPLNLFIDELIGEKPPDKKVVSQDDIVDAIRKTIGDNTKPRYNPIGYAVCLVKGCYRRTVQGTGYCQDHNEICSKLSLAKGGCEVPGEPLEGPDDLVKIRSKKAYGFSMHNLVTKSWIRNLQGNRCAMEDCGRELDNSCVLHHKTYVYDEKFRPVYGVEDPGDLMVICKKCHASMNDVPENEEGSKQIIAISFADTYRLWKEFKNV